MITIEKASPDNNVPALCLQNDLPIHRILYLAERDLEPYLEGKDKVLYLLKDGKEILGFLAVSLSLDEAEVDFLAVQEKEEGKGYATRLLENFFREYSDKKTIFLEVRESNTRAIKLYEKLGFTFYRRRKNYYPTKDLLSSATEDALCYRKELVPMKDEIILAIESSCDETAIAILKNGKELLANTVNTQIADHQRFGGVYPELASRLHLKNITKVLAYALSLKDFDYHTITHVAVTGGPGLPGALQIGVMAAKTIAQYLQVPLISVHHLAGHIYANEYVTDFHYPLIALIASGGNSEIVYLPSPLKFEIIGETEDDAIGEAFDKVARALGLPYPGGVMIDKVSRDPAIETFPLPKPKVDGYNLSYSGLKSHLVRMIEKEPRDENGKIPEDVVKRYARSTEIGFVNQLLDKLYKASQDYHVKQVVVGGGVSANSYLRSEVERRFKGSDIEVMIPPLWCTTDNAAMIAKVAHHMIEQGRYADLDFTSEPNRSLEDE